MGRLVTKPPRSHEELEALIRKRLRDDRNPTIQVFADPVCGWIAVALASTKDVPEIQKRVDAISGELRNFFDLQS